VLITTPTTQIHRRAAAADVPIVEKPRMCGALVDQVRRLLGR
jgi:hypothetical protein